MKNYRLNGLKNKISDKVDSLQNKSYYSIPPFVDIPDYAINMPVVLAPHLLNAVSGVELAFAPWQIEYSQTDILKVRRSSDDSEDIIQADSNGVISDESVMKASGQDLRAWTNDYSDTLFVVEYYFPDGTGMEETNNSEQPEFDPINWMTYFNGNYGLQSVSNDAEGKWEPFFQNDFACVFYCKREAVDDDFRFIGMIRRTIDNTRFLVYASDGSNPRIYSDYTAGSGSNGWTTDNSYSPYGQENTNFFSVSVWSDFSNNQVKFYYNKTLIETVDITGVDPSQFVFSVDQILWHVGTHNNSFRFKGKIIGHALVSNPTASKISTVEEKLKQPVNAYTAFFVENNDGYLLVVSVLERQSFYQNRSCRIRRSSDNAEVNVLWDSNNELSNSSKLEGSGDDLGTWAGGDILFVPKVFDASGYEDHLVQSDTSLQPTLDIANNNVVFASGDELVTEVSSFTINSDFQTIQRTELGEQPIESIKTTAEFYNEIRLETGYSDGQNVNPLTNFADSNKPNGTQGTPSKRGQYVADDINGYPALFVDGVDDEYDLQDSYQTFLQSNFGFVIPFKALDGQGGTQFILSTRSGSDEYSMQFLLLSDGKLRIRYDSNGVSGTDNNGTSIYTTDNSIFASGENPYKKIGFFWDFVNDAPYITIDGIDVAISLTGGGDISVHDPSNYAGTANLFLYNRDGNNFHANAKVTAIVAEPTLSDYRNAFTKLNEKYAIY